MIQAQASNDSGPALGRGLFLKENSAMNDAMDSERESYVLAKALFTAIGTFEKLPEDRRPSSDIDDMLILMFSRYQKFIVIFIEEEGMRPPVALRLVPPDPPPKSGDR